VLRWERNPDRKSGKNEYLEAWTAFFQPLYLQVSAKEIRNGGYKDFSSVRSSHA
jgi:hypothetical protein